VREHSAQFIQGLHGWYKERQRDLPWRNTRNPYKIWLSEIILQQTRVAQGLPYYLKFVEAFPTVRHLANATEESVLRLWQGLGYYSRARNLHACAQQIIENYDGQFPDSYAELLKLKGVGPYTAAAIASFAFNEVVPVVDGNVFRVLARLGNITADIATPQGVKTFQALAADLIDPQDPANYNQAIMEFGALQCTPAAPKCSQCPFTTFCQAYALKKQKDLPVKSKKIKVKKRYFHYFLIGHEQHYLLKKRVEKDIWQNLYDFPLIEQTQFVEPQELPMEPGNPWLQQALQLPGSVLVKESGPFKHVLTHQQLFARFFHIELQGPEQLELLSQNSSFAAYNMEQIRSLPKPILIDNYLKKGIYSLF